MLVASLNFDRPRIGLALAPEGATPGDPFPWDHGTLDVPLISLNIQHGRTQEEARRRLETAVHEVSARFGTLLRRVEWAADRNRVRLEGVGFWVEIWVDAQAVHATGDAPILGRLIGSPLASRVKQIVEQTFRKQLP